MSRIQRIVVWAVASLLLGGCAATGGGRYGETHTTSAKAQEERLGKIAALETVQVDADYKFGVGTVVGAVAGGILGAQFGKGTGQTVMTVVGAAAGAAAGTAVESKMGKKDAQRVTVNMKSGGQVVIVQPVDSRLRNGMNVRIEGSGENARVVPQ